MKLYMNSFKSWLFFQSNTLTIENSEEANQYELKNGNIAIANIIKYEQHELPKNALDAYEILIHVDGVRAGNFTVGIYKTNGQLTAQMDANVPGPFRRLGIASGAYAIGDRIAAKYGLQLSQAPDGSDDAHSFWNSRK